MGSTLGGSDDQIHSLKCKLHKVRDFPPILFTDISQAPRNVPGTLLGLNKYVWNESSENTEKSVLCTVKCLQIYSINTSSSFRFI